MRLMALINDHYSDLIASDRFSIHRTFRTTLDESQAGISGKISRESAPFLWVLTTGISDNEPD